MVLLRKVIIDSFTPLYRDGVEAERICLANISWLDFNLQNELVQMKAGFRIVRQKGLDEPGDQAVYVLPDTAVSYNKYFTDFIAPGGDETKSMLGAWMIKNGNKIGRRVRAKKFNNFYMKDSTEVIYSNGILINFKELSDEVKNASEEDLPALMGVCKFEQEEKAAGGHIGLSAGDLPDYLRPPTDEVRIDDAKMRLMAESAIAAGKTFYFRRKNDGSSWTGLDKSLAQLNPEVGVCSREVKKKLDQRYTAGYKLPSGNVLRQHFDQETQTNCWFFDSTNTMYGKEDVTEFEPIVRIIPDAWVEQFKNNFEKPLHEYCVKYNLQLAISGELVGAGSNGSGNKNNPHRGFPSTVTLFDLWDITTRKLRMPKEELDKFCNETGLQQIPVEFSGVFGSYDELISAGKARLIKIKEEEKILIEGFVVRTDDFSAKLMNDDYDSRK